MADTPDDARERRDIGFAVLTLCWVLVLIGLLLGGIAFTGMVILRHAFDGHPEPSIETGQGR
jgi:hypothetical protein